MFNLLALLSKMPKHLIEVLFRNCANLNTSPRYTLQSNILSFLMFQLFKKELFLKVFNNICITY